MTKDLEKAKELLKSGKFAHVLCKGDQFFVSYETGTEPLADWARGYHQKVHCFLPDA